MFALRRPMFFRHGLDKLIYPVIAIALLIFVSYRPEYHLRTEMPADFSSAASSGTKQRTLEQRIAWAYWESAQMDIQWKYPHGHPLPADPPAERGPPGTPDDPPGRGVEAGKRRRLPRHAGRHVRRVR